MKHNQHQIHEFQSYCKKLTVDRIVIGKLQIHPKYKYSWLPDDPQYRYENYFESAKSSGQGFCPRLYFNMTINWDGQVSPCCLTYGNINNIGDAKSSLLKSVWNNELFQSSRRAVQEPACSDRQPATICGMCKNNLGSLHVPHYRNTFALSM
jgi:radical SAM protein with 4Fe4S-binding SPASM domain